MRLRQPTSQRRDLLLLYVVFNDKGTDFFAAGDRSLTARERTMCWQRTASGTLETSLPFDTTHYRKNHLEPHRNHIAVHLLQYYKLTSHAYAVHKSSASKTFYMTKWWPVQPLKGTKWLIFSLLEGVVISMLDSHKIIRFCEHKDYLVPIMESRIYHLSMFPGMWILTSFLWFCLQILKPNFSVSLADWLHHGHVTWPWACHIKIKRFSQNIRRQNHCFSRGKNLI